MAHILIVENEASISNRILENLKRVGHTCEQACDSSAAASKILEESYDLILLDVAVLQLPDFAIHKQMQSIESPILFMNPQNNPIPLNHTTENAVIPELTARIDAILRRTNKASHIFSFDDICIDFQSKRVFRSGNEIILTPKEYSLFETLVINRNLALSRETLLTLVWEFDYVGDTRTIDVHIQQLRQKLGLRNRIKTVYKIGYRLEI